MPAGEEVLKEQIVHLQKRLREEEEAWKETAKSLVGELRRRRAEVGWLAGMLAEAKACRHRDGCRNSPGDMQCIECWRAGAESASWQDGSLGA